MSSPFPGMDPYLEEPARWPDVHQRLITYIADALQPQVRPRYYARIGGAFRGGSRLAGRPAEGQRATHLMPSPRR